MAPPVVEFLSGDVVVDDYIKKYEIELFYNETEGWSYSGTCGAGRVLGPSVSEEVVKLYLTIERYLHEQGLGWGDASAMANAVITALPYWQSWNETPSSEGLPMPWDDYSRIADAMRNGKELSPKDQRMLWASHELTRRHLESLTPGGSEYFCDPARCAAIIRDGQKQRHQVLKDNMRLRRTLEARP